MTSGSERSAKMKWAKRLGSVTMVAGVLATGQPAAAHPVISDLLNRAMARAATASTRREDVEMPAALVLEPAGHGGEVILAGHRSHSSHKSHSSHRSATNSRSKPKAKAKDVPTAQKAKTPVQPVPKKQNSRGNVVTVRAGDKVIKLRDGSLLVGRTIANNDRVTVICRCISFEVDKSEILSTMPAPVSIDLEMLQTGRCIIIFTNANELRADAVENESTITLIDGHRKRSVPKSRVSKLILLGKATEDWDKNEAGYCVVTLRDGSVLRGKISTEENGEQYLFQNRYGKKRLAAESIFCFEKVEKFSAFRTETVRASVKGDEHHDNTTVEQKAE